MSLPPNSAVNVLIQAIDSGRVIEEKHVVIPCDSLNDVKGNFETTVETVAELRDKYERK